MRGRRARCRACRAAVLVTLTESGRRLLVDPEPEPERGNTALHRDHLGVLRSRRITAERPVMPWERVYVPHPATCPDRNGPPAQPALPEGVASLAAYRARRSPTGGRQ